MSETFLNKAQLSGLTKDARRTEILRAKNYSALDARVSVNETDIANIGQMYAQAAFTSGTTLGFSFTDLPFSSSSAFPSSGEFTVGASTITVGTSGYYQVSTIYSCNTGVTSTGTYVHGYLNKNTSPTVEMITPQSGPYTDGSCSVVLYLTAGDYVKVSVACTGAGTTTIRGGFLTVSRLFT